MAKRRVGLGFTGLGDALVMLRPALRHATRRARWRRRISEAMRDRAYLASVELAKERGAFPLFNADLYLSGGNFASRLPARAQGRDPQARHPQLAPAVDRAHRHHQPRVRRQRVATASSRRSPGPTRARSAWPTARTRSSASRTTRGACIATCAARTRRCRDYFVTALEISAQAHQAMVAAVAPFIDTSISKTVNVPEDYPYARFRGPLPATRGSRA